MADPGVGGRMRMTSVLTKAVFLDPIRVWHLQGFLSYWDAERDLLDAWQGRVRLD